MRTPIALLAGLLLGAASVAPDDELAFQDARARSAHERYAAKLQALRAEFGARFARLRDDYAGRLERAAADATRAGDLDEAVALRAELERVRVVDWSLQGATLEDLLSRVAGDWEARFGAGWSKWSFVEDELRIDGGRYVFALRAEGGQLLGRRKGGVSYRLHLVGPGRMLVERFDGGRPLAGNVPESVVLARRTRS